MISRAALSTPTRGPLWIVAAASLWGTTGAAVSLAPAGTPSTALAAGSLVVGGFLLVVTAGRRPRGAWGVRRGVLLAVGVIAVVGFRLALYAAIERSGVAVTTVVTLGSVPVFIGLASWLLLPASRPSRRWIAASAAAVAGCALLVLAPDGSAFGTSGIALAACAGACCAAYSLVSWHLVDLGSPSQAAMGALFGGAAVLSVPLVLYEGVGWLAAPRAAAVLAYLAIVPTFLAYRCFGRGLRTTAPLLVGTLGLAEPAVAALLGVAVLGERLPPLSWLGLAVLVAGMVGSARRGDRPPATRGTGTAARSQVR